MKLVVDSNIVISALMSPSGTVAGLIFNALRDTQFITTRTLSEAIE